MNGSWTIWTSVLEQFERHAPASVMARVALEHALPSKWIDMAFEEHRQRQYSRELLFSTVIELVTLVSLGLRPSLHAAARTPENLPVSLGALYDKVNRTEPAILRALVRGSAERLRPVAAGWGRARGACGPWRRGGVGPPACRAGSCGCSMAIPCRPARSAWRPCAGI